MAIEWDEAVSKYGVEVDIDELLSDLQDNEEWAGKNGNLELQDNLQNAIMVIAAMRYELNKQSMRGTGDSMQNTVDHPKHYVKEGHKECISEMVEKFGIVPVYWFCMLNAYKYEYRAGLKGDAETDLKKAEWYKNYACKLMDEASTKCCNMKTIPIECYNELKKKLKKTT